MALERVHKILARAGIASRRKAEVLIQEGAVTINGQVAKIGDRAEWGKDAIKVNGKLLQYTAESPIYIGFYKPRGVISMMADPEGRPTIADYLGKLPGRLFPIGRLDFNSEGLILLTNDGETAEKLQKSDQLPRVYEVKVKGHLDAASIRQLQKGAKVEDRLVKPHAVRVSEELTSKSKVQVVLVGSGVHDIKAFFELKGFLVEKITRIAVGNITLTGLTPGQFKNLRPTQMESLIEQPELALRAFEAEQAKDAEKEEAAPAKVSIRTGGEIKKRDTKGSLGDRPSFGDSDRKPRFGGRPGFGRNAERGEDKFSRKPRFDGERKPRFSRDDDRGFGRGDKPSFGGERKPRFSRDDDRGFGRGDKPSFGGERKPRVSRDDDRGFGTDKPSFGGARKPRFSRDDDRGFGTDRPSFGGARKPRFSRDKEEGGFGRADKPSFGGERKPRFSRDKEGGFSKGGDKPRFGGKRGPSSGGFGAKRGPRKKDF